jgi:hypothetical protein
MAVRTSLEITSVGRLKRRDTVRNKVVDGCVVTHIKMGFKGKRL